MKHRGVDADNIADAAAATAATFGTEWINAVRAWLDLRPVYADAWHYAEEPYDRPWYHLV